MKTLFKDKKYIALIVSAFLIPVFSVLVGFLAGSYAPFGPKNILTTAGYNDYIPYFYELYDRIHSGQGLGYSMHSGLGYDFTSLLAYYISDPLNFIILIFPRNSIISVLNILYMLKIGMAGSCMSLFLVYKKSKINNPKTENNKTENAAKDKKIEKSNFVIGFKSIPESAIIRFIMTFDWIILALSIAYALSLPMISLGMNITYTGAISIFPIVMLGLDLLINEKKSLLFVISLIISTFCNLHITIISIIFIILYTITRDYKNLTLAIKVSISTIVSIIISIICSSIVIVFSITGGFFASDNSLFFPSLIFDNPMNCMRQLMSQGILSYISMYGRYDVAICILSVFLLFCYIFQSDIKTSCKLKNIGLLFFILSGTCVSTVRFLFNGFNLCARNTIHFSYIICFLFILIAYEELQHIQKLGAIKTLIAFICSSAVILSGFYLSDNYDNSAMFIKTLEFLFGYFLIQIIFTSKSMTKTLFIFVTSILLLIETVIPNISNITNAGKFYTSQKLSNVHSLQLYETSKMIHESEKDARVLIYNSSASNDTPLTSDLSGYDYVISTSRSNPYGYISPIKELKKDDSVITVNIFKPETSIKHVFFPSEIYNYNYNLQNPFNSSNQLSMLYLNGLEIFKLINVNVEPSMASDGSVASFATSFDDVNDGHVYFNAYYTNHLCDASEQKQGMPTQEFPKSNDLNINYTYSGAVLESDNYNNLLTSITQNSKNINNFSNSFDVSVNESGYISTGFSNISSLNFFVNGKKVNPISKINNNALVPVNKGTSHIEIRYSYKWFIISVISTLIGLILIILYNKPSSIIKNLKENNITGKISYFIEDNKVYVLSSAIVITIFILCQMITSSKPFGVYAVVKDDGFAQYFAWFTEYIKSVKNNTIFSPVSFNSGGFEDTFRYNISYNYNFAFGIPAFLLVNSRHYMMLFTLYYILFLVFPVISFIFYLTHKYSNRYDKHDNRLIIYALLYTLASYTAVFFQFYIGFRLLAYLPLLILSFEQLIYNKKNVFYICILVLMMLDVYTCFLVCEFLAIYFFTSEFEGFKDFIYKGIRFAVCSITAALISSFNIIPFYYSTRLSPYLSTDNHQPSLFKFYTSYIKQIAEYHTGNAYRTISDNNAQTASYCGLIMLFVVLLYLANRNISVKVKVKKTILLLLLFAATNNELLNYVLHGFHFQTLAPNRFAIFIIFLLVTMLSDIKLGDYEYSKKVFAFSIIPVSILMTLIYIYQYGSPTITIKLSYALLICYVAIAVYNLIKKANKQHYILYIAILDILLNAVIVFPMNIGSKSDMLNVAEVFDHIADDNPEMKEFNVNTEYITDSSAYKNIGKLTDLHSLSFFDSAFTQDTMDYISYYNVATGSNSITYNSNPLADMMLRIRYHIVNEYNETSTSIYPTVYQQNEYTLHQNPNNIGLGFIHSNNETTNISVDDIDKSNYKNSFDYQNAIVNYLGGQNIYSVLDCTDQFSTLNIYYTIDESYTTDDLHNRGTSYAPITLHFPSDFNGTIYMDVLGKILYLGKVDQDNQILSFDYPINEIVGLDKFKPCIALYNENEMSELNKHLADTLLYNTNLKDNTISTSINSDNDGSVFISLPFYEGWDIYVDGIKADKFKYLGGIGINITKGNHKILMKYHSPYALLGIIISITTLLIISIYILVKSYNKNKIIKGK